MRNDDYKGYLAAIREFERECAVWSRAVPGLAAAQKRLAALCDENDYALETSIVYNKALNDVAESDAISWIIVADNPGKREQEAAQNKYLVGRSGLMAEAFFARELGLDFRSAAVIINKTPVHTPKTAQLKTLIRLCPEAEQLFRETQDAMVRLLHDLHAALRAKIWVMGISELKPKGLFAPWLDAVRAFPSDVLDDMYFFNHFSMGSFSSDLKKRRLYGETIKDAIIRIGRENKERFL